MDDFIVQYNRVTDEEILEWSQGRLITTYQDFELKRNSRTEKNRLYPVVGGVYDSSYFGSVYSDTCNCGRCHVIGSTCQVCGSKVLSEDEKYRRWAYIDLGMYYCMNTKLKGMMDLLLSVQINFSKAAEFFEFSRISLSSTPKIMELCQFEWDEDLQEIIADPKITNESHSSYEGFERILKDHYPELLNDYHSLVNRYIAVPPAIYRNAVFNPYDPITKLSIPVMSSVFQSIVFLKMNMRELLTNTYSDPSQRILLKAILRRYCSKNINSLSEVLRTSKENIFRILYSSRIEDSGRAPIVGDPSLKINEVLLPIALAYELLRTDFIAYMSKTLGISPTESELRYRKATNETLELFKKYTPTRRVIMTRPPSLHRYNNMSFVIGVTEDQAIHFPPTSVSPFAADYDGDCMNFYLIPEEFNELADKNASPATQLYYEATGDFIWKPNQDMLYGLTLATRVTPVSEDELIKLNKYISIEDIKKDYEDQVIMYPNDPVILNGELTTLSREVVSEIIHKSIDDLYGSGFVNASNLGILLSYIYGLEDFTDVYQKLVQYGLEVLTLEGATVPSLAELISIDTSEFTPKMKSLLKKAESDPKYYYDLEKEYADFISNTVKKLSPDLTRRIKDSGRMKMQQITDMIVPQMTVNHKGEYYVASNSLVNGLSHEDYVRHAINNRSLIQTKTILVPEGGYLNRQLITAGQGVKMNRKSTDKEDQGVYIPRNKATGRTTLNGEVLDPSDSEELVLVRSFATSNSNDLSPDLISEIDQSFEDQSNLGLRFTSSVAESITQGALSLKHKGILRNLDPHLVLTAPENCKVRKVSADTIEVKIGDKKINHFVPMDFILLDPKGTYKKGEHIGFRPVFTDPSYKSTSMVDLIGAVSTQDIGKKSWEARASNYSLCVSPVGGRVHYDMNYIYIGSFALPRNPERVYYYLEGTEIKPYTIICDGVLDCVNISQYCPRDRDYYGCFRSYFLSILPNTQEHIVEYVFRTINVRDDEGHLRYVGVKSKAKEDKSILTNLGYEGQTNIIPEVLRVPQVTEDPGKYQDLFKDYFINILASELKWNQDS